VAFEIYEAGRGEYRWLYRAENGKVAARSDRAFDSRSDAETAIDTFKHRVAEAQVAGGTSSRGQVEGTRDRVLGFAEKLAVPIVVAVLAAVSAFLGARSAVEGDVKVKAAEIAFAGSPTLGDVQGRIQMLAQLYPNELGEWKKAAESGDRGTGFLFPTANTARWAFLQLAMQKTACADQVTQLWSDLFGPDRASPQPTANYDVFITGVKPLTPCPNAGASPSP